MRKWEHWRTTINAPDLNAVLDAQGLNGWELVQLRDMRTGWDIKGEFAAVFKREIEPDRDVEGWIRKSFAGHGAAVRKESDPPLPGEPYMPMDDAKVLVRLALAHFNATHL